MPAFKDVSLTMEPHRADAGAVTSPS
jgi:hypothetical protein